MVHGLTRVSFVGLEEEPERFVAEYDWHVLELNGVRNLRVKWEPSPNTVRLREIVIAGSTRNPWVPDQVRDGKSGAMPYANSVDPSPHRTCISSY